MKHHKDLPTDDINAIQNLRSFTPPPPYLHATSPHTHAYSRDSTTPTAL